MCLSISQAEFCKRDKFALQHQNVLANTMFLGHYRTEILKAGSAHSGTIFHAVIQLGPSITTDDVTIYYYDCWRGLDGVHIDNCMNEIKSASDGSAVYLLHSLTPPWDGTGSGQTITTIGTKIYDFGYDTSVSTTSDYVAAAPHNHIITKVVVTSPNGDHTFYEETYLCQPGKIPLTSGTGCADCAIDTYAVLGQSTSCTTCPSGWTAASTGSTACANARRLSVVLDTTCIKKEIMYGNLNQMDETGECTMACVDITGIQSPVSTNLIDLSYNSPVICAEIRNNGLYYYTKDCIKD